VISFPEFAEWPEYNKEQFDEIVDVSSIQDEEGLVNELAAVFCGKESHSVENGSLDALNEVVGDWFIDNWERKMFSAVLFGDWPSRDPKTFAHIVSVFSDGIISGIRFVRWKKWKENEAISTAKFDTLIEACENKSFLFFADFSGGSTKATSMIH